MAALSMTSAQVQIPKGKLGCGVRGLSRKCATAKPAARSVSVRAAAVSGEVPDMGKRNVMNLLLVGAIGLPATSLIGGFAYFFVPPRCASSPQRVVAARPSRASRQITALKNKTSRETKNHIPHHEAHRNVFFSR